MVHLQLFVGLLDDHGEHVQVEGFEAFPEPQVFFRDHDFESETIVVILEKRRSGRVVLVREIYGVVRDAKELLLLVAWSLQMEVDFELWLAVSVQKKRSVPALCARAGHSSDD